MANCVSVMKRMLINWIMQRLTLVVRCALSWGPLLDTLPISMFLLQVASNDYCGLLDDTDGVFRDFIAKLADMAAAYRENCQFDVCANMDDALRSKRAACGSLGAFAALAFGRGLGLVDWRSAADCGRFIIYILELFPLLLIMLLSC